MSSLWFFKVGSFTYSYYENGFLDNGFGAAVRDSLFNI